MIVGFTDNSAFNKIFDGQGFTLKNINIDTTKLPDNNSKNYIGLFGKAEGASFANINVDYQNGGINASNDYVGGFVGYIDGLVDGVSVKNIRYINNNVDIILNSGYMTYYGTGGFTGDANGVFRNIVLDNIKNIKVYAKLTDNSKIPDDTYYDPRTMLNYGLGGFAGASFGMFENIHIKNSGNFQLNYETKEGNAAPSYSVGIGGFVGNAINGIYNNILLQDIKDIQASFLKASKGKTESLIGGFAGRISNGTYTNISIDQLANIEYFAKISASGYAGGFAGWIDRGDYNNISLSGISKIALNNEIKGSGGYVGGFVGATNLGAFRSIIVNDIGGIYTKNYGDAYVGGFVGYTGATWNSNVEYTTFKDIIISNINTIKSYNSSSSGYMAVVGGFAGLVQNKQLFDNILIENIDEIVVEDTNKYNAYTLSAGGFAGHINSGEFNNISINGIKKIKANDVGYDEGSSNGRMYTGGFAGGISNAKLNNISIKDIKEIQSMGNWSHAGGFSSTVKDITAKNISIKNINNILSSAGGGFAYAGGFIGSYDGYNSQKNTTIENISLNKINNINAKSSDHTYTGGFVGGIVNGHKVKISFVNINDIGNIIASVIGRDGNVYAGGFAGSNYQASFNNISLNHIQNIQASYTPTQENRIFGKNVYAGGFIGYNNNGSFYNISLNDINNIYASNKAQYEPSEEELFGKNGAYTGGFIGFAGDNSVFRNIYIYFAPNSTINSESILVGKNYTGMFMGKASDEANKNIGSEIHIYHKNNELSNAISDKAYWGSTNNKIQIHTYTDEKQGYKNFEKAVLGKLVGEGLKKDENGNLVFTTSFDVEKPSQHLPNITYPDIIESQKPLIPNITSI
ncbi:hypothetical protein I9P32_03230, partial [Campylobacter peloridis]|nr:hypothetical protein [Campylobacter peloridis]